jgi:hypothetical protein
MSSDVNVLDTATSFMDCGSRPAVWALVLMRYMTSWYVVITDTAKSLFFEWV